MEQTCFYILLHVIKICHFYYLTNASTDSLNMNVYVKSANYLGRFAFITVFLISNIQFCVHLL